jgi:hypothetical protein
LFKALKAWIYLHRNAARIARERDSAVEHLNMVEAQLSDLRRVLEKAPLALPPPDGLDIPVLKYKVGVLQEELEKLKEEHGYCLRYGPLSVKTIVEQRNELLYKEHKRKEMAMFEGNGTKK